MGLLLGELGLSEVGLVRYQIRDIEEVCIGSDF